MKNIFKPKTETDIIDSINSIIKPSKLRSLLYNAINNNNIKIVKFLLNKYDKLTPKNSRAKQNMLYFLLIDAIELDYYEIAKLLVNKGTIINNRIINVSSINGDPRYIKLLTSRNDVNESIFKSKNDNDIKKEINNAISDNNTRLLRTMIYVAEELNNIEAIKILLNGLNIKHGVKNSRANENILKHLLYYAVDRDHYEIAKILVNKGIDLVDASKILAQNKDIKYIKLLKYHNDINESMQNILKPKSKKDILNDIDQSGKVDFYEKINGEKLNINQFMSSSGKTIVEKFLHLLSDKFRTYMNNHLLNKNRNIITINIQKYYGGWDNDKDIYICPIKDGRPSYQKNPNFNYDIIMNFEEDNYGFFDKSFLTIKLPIGFNILKWDRVHEVFIQIELGLTLKEFCKWFINQQK